MGSVARILEIAPVFVVFDERFDLGFNVAGEIVIIQQDAVSAPPGSETLVI